MDFLNSILDILYYNCIGPLFQLLGRLLNLIFIMPLAWLHVPIWLHVALLAILTSFFSFFLRRLLNVEKKAEQFRTIFAEKRRNQQELQVISDKYSREALYKSTDEDLNNDFNTYLAYHYARYMTVYMLPLFLIMAWLNMVFSEEMLLARFNSRFVVLLPENSLGMTGLSVTLIFLFVYVLCLIIGFQILRRRKRITLKRLTEKTTETTH